MESSLTLETTSRPRPPIDPAADTGVFAGLLAGTELPPAQLPSQWADEHWMLSSDSSAEPGRFNSKRAAYQPGMLDVIVEPGVRMYVLKCSAQVGKTTILLIHIGYTACRTPAPILIAFPSRDVGEAFSKERLQPAIADVPAMAAVFPHPKERSAGNTLTHKKFAGGFLAFAWANSPVTMRMRAIKLALADEVDAYQGTANKEGDPLDLLKKRGTTFWDFRMGVASTPLEKHRSRISRLYDESDRRKYMVKCPECQGEQVLEWKVDKAEQESHRPSNILWDRGRPETARYACEHCGSLLDDLDLKRAVQGGRWVATKPFTGIAGFHIWELYSPWSSLAKIVGEYEHAVGYTDRLMTFVNTVLGEEWEGEVIGTVDVETLLARREEFEPYQVDERAALLTAAVDVQHDRLEVQVQSWGAGDERWVQSHQQIVGDPNGRLVWEQLEEQLTHAYQHPSGRELYIEAVALDSGGHHTQKVYDWCAINILKGRLWWPIKGVAGFGKPIWKRSEARIKGGIPLFLVGVDDAKSSVFAALSVDEPGPNYVHLPVAFHPDRFEGDERRLIRESLKRLTAEKCLVTVSKLGFQEREWTKPEGARNEEFDCAVYNLAARRSLAVDDEVIAKRLDEFRRPPEPEIDAAAVARMFKRR